MIIIGDGDKPKIRNDKLPILLKSCKQRISGKAITKKWF